MKFVMFVYYYASIWHQLISSVFNFLSFKFFLLFFYFSSFFYIKLFKTSLFSAFFHFFNFFKVQTYFNPLQQKVFSKNLNNLSQTDTLMNLHSRRNEPQWTSFFFFGLLILQKDPKSIVSCDPICSLMMMICHMGAKKY